MDIDSFSVSAHDLILATASVDTNICMVASNILGQPGYYGSKGSSELFKILARLFLESQFLTHEKANPQKPSEYIQHVLVPEAGVRLIAEDRRKSFSGDPISLGAAREIMMESVEFGSYVHDIEQYS